MTDPQQERVYSYDSPTNTLRKVTLFREESSVIQDTKRIGDTHSSDEYVIGGSTKVQLSLCAETSQASDTRLDRDGNGAAN